jgi:hypothetical protein
MRRFHAVLSRLGALGLAILAGAHAGHAQLGPADTDEERVWREAQLSGEPSAFERYLELYPVGRHAADAFRCLVLTGLEQPDPVCVFTPAAGPDTGAATRLGELGADPY